MAEALALCLGALQSADALLRVWQCVMRCAALMRRRVLIDGVEFPGSDPFWLGPQRRMATGIQHPDGQLQGHFVEVIALSELSYRSLGVVEPEVAAKVLALLQQVG